MDPVDPAQPERDNDPVRESGGENGAERPPVFRPVSSGAAMVVVGGIGAAAFLVTLMLAVEPLAYPMLLMVLLLPLSTAPAVYAGRGHIGWGLGFLGAAAAGSMVAAVVSVGLTALAGSSQAFAAALRSAPMGAVEVTLTLSSGLLLGQAVAAGRGYGRTLGTVAAVPLAALVLHALAFQQDWAEAMRLAYGTVLETFRKLTADKNSELNPEAWEAGITWLRAHWAEFFPGVAAVIVQLEAALLVTLVAGGLRRFAGATGLRDSFRDLRLPEWAVWIVIACAGLWFADRQWSLPATVRIPAWNTAVALSGAYFLNGLAVLIYTVTLLRPGALVLLALVFMLWYLGFYPVMVFVGLFDTWGAFRAKLAQWAARAREQSGDDA